MGRENSTGPVLRSAALFLIIVAAVLGCQSITGPSSEDQAALEKGGKERLWLGGTGDIEAIRIFYSSVRVLKDEDGTEEWVVVDPSPAEKTTPEYSFDLLDLVDGFEAVLGGATLEPGVYLRMRVPVVRAEITVDGRVLPLKVAGNSLRIRESFVVGPSGVPALPLDFDAAQAVYERGRGKNRFMMKGRLWLGDLPAPPETGTIAGEVVPTVFGLVNLYRSGTYEIVVSVQTSPDFDGFSFADIEPGTYDLEAAAPGYYSGWEYGIVLDAGEMSDGHVLEMTEEVGGEKK